MPEAVASSAGMLAGRRTSQAGRRAGTAVGAPFAWLAVLVTTAAAAAIGWHLLAQPHALYGVQQYDDGAYLGGALQLVAGRLPYRDFAFVQPPGVVLLLAPVAAFGHLTSLRAAVALSRIVTVAAIAADVALVARLVRHRGVIAPLVAGAVLALNPAAFSVERAFLVEPFLILACLIGLSAMLDGDYLASSRRLFAAGVAFGIAGTLKAMAIVVLAVALAAAVPLVRRGVGAAARASLLPIAGGALVGFAVPCLPFFVAAPGAFVHDVVVTQLARSAATTTPWPARLSFILGARQNGIGPIGVASADHVAEVVALGVAALVGALLLLPALAGRGTRLEWVALLGTVATGAAMALPQVFYAHYAWFCAPFVALALALSVDRLVRIGARFVGRLRGPGLSGAVLIGAASIVFAAAAAGAVRLGVGDAHFGAETVARSGDPGPKIAAVLPAGACAVSDAAILLITADRYATASGCPAVVDPTGAWLVADPHHPEHAAGPRSPALVADWEAWFAAARYVVLSRPTTFRIPWTPSLEAFFSARFVLDKASGAFIYQRRTAG